MVKKDDLIMFIAIIFMLIGGFIIAGYFILDKVNSCTRDPLNYAVKEVESKFDVDLVYGTMYLINTQTNAKDTIDFGNNTWKIEIK